MPMSDDKLLKRQMAIIDSMTRGERKNPDVLKAKPQEAHRLRLRQQGRRDQSPAENASEYGGHDEGDGRRQARSLAGLAASSVWAERWAAACRAQKRLRNCSSKCLAAELACQRIFRVCRGFPVSAPAAGDSARLRFFPERRITGRDPEKWTPVFGKDHAQNEKPHQRKHTSQSKYGAKNVSCYSSVARRHQEASLLPRRCRRFAFPRDGRFIQRLGYFNPLLPKIMKSV